MTREDEFQEWLETLHPRPGAGAYPALPGDIKKQRPTSQAPKRRGRPKSREKSEKEIENALLKLNIGRKRLSLNHVMLQLEPITGLGFVNLDRNFKDFIRERVKKFKTQAKGGVKIH